MNILRKVPKPPAIIPTEQELMASWQSNLNEPLLTIICITYNHVSFIADALHGFLMQRTDFPFRIVVHDDASTDGTQEVIQLYSAKYPHVIKTVLQVTNLLSRGMQIDPYVSPLIAGPYIGLCEGDDYWIDPHKIQRQVEFLSAYPAYVASTENAITFFPETDQIQAFSKQPEHDINVIELLGPRPFATASAVYRSSAIAGRTHALKSAGDIGTWCYLASKGRIKYHPIYSSVYRRGKHGMVLGTDRLQWARKMEEWNHDVARFLANRDLDQVFRERIFEGYRSACYHRQKISFDRFKALAKAFQYSPRKTVKFVTEAGPLGRLRSNPLTKRIDRHRDIRADHKHLESAIIVLRTDIPKTIASNLVVSLTSNPARIMQAWMSIESLLRQDVVPGKLALILAEEEFQGRILPKSLRRQTRRGLEIVWVTKPIHKYNKASLTGSLFPGFDVVTAEDGMLYPHNMIRDLIEAKKLRPKEIIGRSGWVVGSLGGALLPSKLWTLAASHSAGSFLLLTIGAGVLFPASFLRSGILNNQMLAMELCPEAEDLWVWAAAIQEGIGLYCLGMPIPYEMVSQARSKDRALGSHQYDEQLAKLIEYFSRSEKPLVC